MPLYFLLHDAHRFHEEIRPALGRAWRERSFGACRALCEALAPVASSFAQRYHTGSDEPLLARVSRGLPFDRDFWRMIVGEVLLYAAAAVPDIPTAPDTLAWLLLPRRGLDAPGPRAAFSPIEQAHFGSRDLVLGAGFYRPESSGYNDTEDVARLHAYLRSIDPAAWSSAELASLEGLTDDEERAAALEYAREALAALAELYEQAATAGQVVVCEVL
jgi:hypothetical protein